MAARIKGKTVEHQDVLFGVRFDDGFIYEAEDEEDAVDTADYTGGTIVACEWYQTAWAEVEE
jgi:hypothetical protein